MSDQGEVIYTAPVPHICEMANWGRKERHPYGSIIKCSECSTYWVRKNSYEHWVEYWHPVKWWEFKERRIIKKWEADQ